MKINILFTILISLLVFQPATAQRDRSAESRIEAHVKMMTEHLDLTQEQIEQMKAILANYSDGERHSFGELHEKVSEILTPEQREIAGAMVRDSVRTRMMRGDRGRARYERMQGRRGDRDRGIDYRQRGRDSRMDGRRSTRNGQMDRRRSRSNNRMRGGRGYFDGSRSMMNFSSEQREAMREITRKLAGERRAFLEENPDPTRSEMREFGANLREMMAEAMDSVMTVEQRLMMMPRTTNRRGGSSLNLSEEQETQISVAMDAHRTEMKQWNEANPEASREERMEKAREHREAFDAALEEILTPEQQQRLNRMRMGGRRGR